MGRSGPVAMVLALVWGASAACSPPLAEPIAREAAVEAWVGAVCELEQACECRDPSATCASEQTNLERMFEDAEAAGLVYDAQCVGSLVAGLRRQGCASRDDPDATTCEERCAPFFGADPKGTACEWVASTWIGTTLVRASHCAQGLTCADGTCQPACGSFGPACSACVECVDGRRCLGGLCRELPKVGEPCPHAKCVDSAYCDLDTGTCRALPTDGQACVAGVCAPDAGCDGSICVARLGVGERCAAQTDCVTDYCPDGFCRALPGVGEPCPLDRCGGRGICDAGTCRAEVAICDR